jgi:N-acetylmuramoyl-L-alanine amidase
VPRRSATLCALAAAALLTAGCGGAADSAAPSVTAAPSPSRAPDAAAPNVPPTASPPATAPPAPQATVAQRVAALRPPIVQKPIPLTPKRRRETVAYAERHYGIRSSRLQGPHVIVEHYTETPDVASTYNTFAPDVPDVELHELPGLCSQFVIGSDGTIYQLTPLTFMCRHTVGLNYTAIGIEHVGSSDAQILADAKQMRASLRLTQWLRCRSRIATKNVIGHNESLSSPYHHENVARLRTQTHGDWVPADMRTYRSRLAALGPCPR